MRFSKYCLLAGLIALTPYVALAQDPTIDEIESSGGSATENAGSNQGGIQFDPRDNTIGNPNNRPSSLTSGTLRQLTFLSGATDPVSITFNIINFSLGFLGLLSLIFILYAGFKWFTARDNEEEATKAKDIIKGAVVGLAIVLGSMGIAQLLFSTLQTSTTATSLMDWVIPPAYAEETYRSEDLPFDPWAGPYIGNVALEEGSVGSLIDLDLGTADPVTLTYAIINILITLLGMGFLVLLIYAGVLWATARGNEDQITKAKTILKQAVIGLIIILAAFGISSLIFSAIYQYTTFDNPSI